MPMRGLPDNSQLLHSYAIIPAAYSTPAGKHCAVHQMAELLGKVYHLLAELQSNIIQNATHNRKQASSVLP